MRLPSPLFREFPERVDSNAFEYIRFDSFSKKPSRLRTPISLIDCSPIDGLTFPHSPID